jgi:hypothetical protein
LCLRTWEISLREPFPEVSEHLAEGSGRLPELPGIRLEYREGPTEVRDRVSEGESSRTELRRRATEL